MAGPVITLLTDFGGTGGYPAEVKGAILGINPSVTIVDVTHDVPPRDVASGAFLLWSVVKAFPPGTIHVAVVDPGVGSERVPLLLVTPDATFVGPDNGLFSLVLGDNSGEIAGRPFEDRYRAPLPPSVRAYRLAEPAYWRLPVSDTFHGRDLFGPVAAHLSLGTPPESMGPRVESAERLVMPRLEERDDALHGAVLHVDRFGNLVTNVPGDRVPRGGLAMEVAGEMVAGLSAAYEPDRKLVAVVGSHGYVEVAVPGGSAAALLGVGRGAVVRVRAVPV